MFIADNVFDDVLPACRKVQEIVAKVFEHNAEHVLAKFVQYIFEKKLAVGNLYEHKIKHYFDCSLILYFIYWSCVCKINVLCASNHGGPELPSWCDWPEKVGQIITAKNFNSCKIPTLEAKQMMFWTISLS